MTALEAGSRVLRLPALLLSIVSATLAACGAPTPVTAPPREARFVDPTTRETLSFEEALARLDGARVVYLGERHDRPEDHAMQARFAQALAARAPITIGFEMVQRPYQSALDRYASGELDEAGLLAGVEWEDRWGFDFAMYRPLFALGPDGARLVALNAPRELTRRIAREGLDALDDETRAALPEMVLDDAAHRAAVGDALAHHPHMDEATLARFYAAQVLWDETMAEAVAAAAEGDRTVVVVAGTMHVIPSAIPARAARRGVTSHAIVQPLDEAELDAEPPAADVWFVTP